MPRMSKEEKQASRDRIVDAAASLFRERGITGTSVGDVMSAAGMTHGGFYRHFTSKEDLVDHAFARAAQDHSEPLRHAIDSKGAKSAILGFVEGYLSQHHIETPSTGCPMAALSEELGRTMGGAINPAAKGTEKLVTLFMDAFDGTEADRHRKATGLFALLVGTVTLARSAANDADRQRIADAGLAQARHLLS